MKYVSREWRPVRDVKFFYLHRQRHHKGVLLSSTDQGGLVVAIHSCMLSIFLCCIIPLPQICSCEWFLCSFSLTRHGCDNHGAPGEGVSPFLGPFQIFEQSVVIHSTSDLMFVIHLNRGWLCKQQLAVLLRSENGEFSFWRGVGVRANPSCDAC